VEWINESAENSDTRYEKLHSFKCRSGKGKKSTTVLAVKAHVWCSCKAKLELFLFIVKRRRIFFHSTNASKGSLTTLCYISISYR
jgi:hypothetical protein